MKAAELHAKSVAALRSAKLLLETGDTDGSCNRAYYAMFDAARAALVQTQTPVSPLIAKTHSGLISAFSLHLVKTGHISADFGRALSRAHEIRLLADYTGDPVAPHFPLSTAGRRQSCAARQVRESQPRVPAHSAPLLQRSWPARHEGKACVYPHA